jgi:heme-degrading monooxygenase HmoA
MIEVDVFYEFRRGVDQQQEAYLQWARKTIGAILQQPGIIEFRAYRNVMISPEVRTTSVWETLADWAHFAESTTWQELLQEMRTYATNIRVELWGPSSVVPEPLRPGG